MDKSTSLDVNKEGPPLVRRCSGEAKASAKSIQIDDICDKKGIACILDKLDNFYAVASASQVGTDFANFLDYSWIKSLSVEKFVAGFCNWLDEISSLSIVNKLKRPLLLR